MPLKIYLVSILGAADGMQPLVATYGDADAELIKQKCIEEGGVAEIKEITLMGRGTVKEMVMKMTPIKGG